ncbi:MAG: hypothetical protein K0B09_01015 [Bacteroidales bacterium]|nr:hypothetical protein [Bacteroidales bacterium]
MNPLFGHNMLFPLSSPAGAGVSAVACNGYALIADFQFLSKSITDFPNYSHPVTGLQPSLTQGPEKNQQ